MSRASSRQALRKETASALLPESTENVPERNSTKPASSIRADWSNEATQVLVEVILDELHSIGGAYSDLKKPNWTHIYSNYVNGTCGMPESSYSHAQMTSKLTTLGKEFRVFDSLVNNTSGFGWDEATQMVKAHNDVWDRIILSNKDYAKYRMRSLPFYKELKDIFYGNFATGKHATISTATASRHTPVVATASLKQTSIVQHDIIHENEGDIEEENGNDDVIVNTISQLSISEALQKLAGSDTTHALELFDRHFKNPSQPPNA